MSGQNKFSDKLFERGVEQIYPSREELDKFLAEGNKLKIFYGIDPTGSTLHIGHGSNLLRLKALQEAGHEITILYGDFTAMIGDPTDKLSARKKLLPEQIKENYASYRDQIGRILDLKKTKFTFNKDWLGSMSFAEVVEIASEFTVGQMIERDMFQERIKNGEPIYIHEFLYPLMQGYDSVMMDINAEMGASDQIFNMLAGRTMMKRRGREKFVIANKLLVDPTGKKMGKSEGNMVALSDDPKDMYGKVMSWPDSLMPLAFEICTELPALMVAEILAGNPRDAKMRLAKEIVSIFASPEEAEHAEADFISKFQDKEIPDDIPEIGATKNMLLRDILVTAEAVSSNSDFRRLVEGGGVTILPDTKVVDVDLKVTNEMVVKVGKKKFFKITLN
ncbi:MAG: tyrosine--tRNA ligase [Candidatus Vogelbacteria bacterium RIFOXYD1_FULL_44_32]|uniref:Tyrosine--tRNA ligase n=1 Tax=Candidatus Vogelbacteria bacterium RIFOXYD1_FULL_44_32 TaxID=1802438 RepID=A0A1G2QFR4_9BACT|nr:MAG: tyrosine--tRNA ligase [Candidatus Vogelbacteria bacterium RIFOXYD1_FULL_44_32]